jgi:drug/metabolite transporter (DMT)-like permease
MDPKVISIGALTVVLMAVKPCLQALASRRADGLSLHVLQLTCLTELLKLAICSVVETHRLGGAGAVCASLRLGLPQLLSFAAPALLYLVMNAITIFALGRLDPPVWQLLCNWKILATALMSALLLGRQIRTHQWFALLLLLCGSALARFDGTGRFDWSPALLLPVLTTTLSAVAGVLSEKRLKERGALSLCGSNIVLAGWSIGVNVLALLTLWLEGSARLPRLSEVDRSAALAVVNDAANGLVLSAVMKFSSNIVKIYAFSLSVLVTAAISRLLFAYTPPPNFWPAAALVLVSVALFNLESVAGRVVSSRQAASTEKKKS